MTKSGLHHWIGREERRSDVVTLQGVARFAATLDAPASIEHAPDGFHWCLCLPDAPTNTLGPDGHPPKGGFLPIIAQPRRMWAASEIEFSEPLPISAKVERTSRIIDINEKAGASGALVFVKVAHETRLDGRVAIAERQTIVYRDHPATPTALPPVEDQRHLGDWQWRRDVLPDAPLLFRYSALTFNTHRIHYDLPYAQEGEGYPALVVHGPLIATLLLDLCRREAVSCRLGRFAFRAVSPAYVGQPIHLAGGRNNDIITLRAFGGDGRVLMEADATLRG